MARIPRHFHFIFGLRPQTEAFALPYYLALESCFAVNRPERVTLYYHHLPWGPWWDRITRERPLELEKVPLVPLVAGASVTSPEARFRYAHHADWIRLDKLLSHGGVYADMDTLFVNPIPDALFDERFVIGAEHPVSGERSLCNALMLAERGSALVARWLEAFGEAFDGSWTAHSCALVTELAEQHPELVRIEPERTFTYHSHTVEGVRRLFTGLDRDTAGIASMHLWSHLWWDFDQMTRTTLWGGLLSEDFIRSVETTYTVLARPFLPAEPTGGQPVSKARAAALQAALEAVRVADRLYDASAIVREPVMKAVHPILAPAVHALRRWRAGR